MSERLPHEPASLFGEEAGYTLIELVVALLITLVLGGVLFAVHLATTQWIEPWRREVTLQNHVHLIAQRLVADLAHAEQLIDDGAGLWRLTYRSGRTVQYRHEDGVLTRDGQTMHPATLLVFDLRLVPSKAETRYALRRRDGPFEDERSVMQVEVHLAVQSRERILAVVTTTALRQHRPWWPLR